MMRRCHFVTAGLALLPSKCLLAAAPPPPTSRVTRRRTWHRIGTTGSSDNQRRNQADNIALWPDLSDLPDSFVPSSAVRVICVRCGDIQDDGEEKWKISLSPLAFMSLFGFLGGWSHAICNKKFDCYTSLMTGHYMNMSMFLAEKNWPEALWRVSVIGSYAGGAAAARSIELKFERQGASGASGAAVSTNRHFKMIAPIVFAIFTIADRLERAKVALLSFGYGLIYPSVSAALGATITHLMTGHTTNVARLVGGKQIHHKGMKTSTCILCSIIAGAVFGTKVLGLLGDEFPYFSVLGFLYATALLLLL